MKVSPLLSPLPLRYIKRIRNNRLNTKKHPVRGGDPYINVYLYRGTSLYKTGIPQWWREFNADFEVGTEMGTAGAG